MQGRSNSGGYGDFVPVGILVPALGLLMLVGWGMLELAALVYDLMTLKIRPPARV
jgi:hypothetical protein